MIDTFDGPMFATSRVSRPNSRLYNNNDDLPFDFVDAANL